MKNFFLPAAALVVLGILMVMYGFAALPSDAPPILALGLMALFAGGVLQIWSQRRS